MALRYVRSGRRAFASFIIWTSVVGLALGVLVLTVVISVMNGFDAELKQRLLGAVPHIFVEQAEVATSPFASSFTSGTAEIDSVAAMPEVKRAYPFFIGAGMVTRSSAVNPVSVYGINSLALPGLAEFDEHMLFGDLQQLAATNNGIVLGAPLARHLGLLPGDSVALVLSEPNEIGITPRMLRVELVGTYQIGAELDYNLAFINLALVAAEDLRKMGKVGWRVDLAEPMLAGDVGLAISKLHPGWRVTNWTDSYGQLFSAVALEKTMMFLVLLLVVAIAAFNIVSGQLMVVTQKQSDIAILRTMGANRSTILRIFLIQGLFIALMGIGVGLALGVYAAHHVSFLLQTAEQWFSFQFLEGTYFVELPSVVKLTDLLVVAGIALLLSGLSAWYPARKAAQQNPVDGLHAH